MPTITLTRAEMEEKLGQVFAPEQTESLVYVLDAIRQAELQRAADTRDLKRGLAGLTKEVKTLAVAQRSTDERLGELAAAQRSTDERLGAFQEQVDRRFADMAAAQQRTDERLGELAAAQQRTDTQMERMSRAVEALAHSTDRLHDTVGSLVNRFGFSLEEFVAALLPPWLERNYGISELTLERRYFDLGEGLPEEVDLVGTGQRDGQPVTVLVECRTSLGGSAVRDLASKLDKVAATLVKERIFKALVAMNVHPTATAAAEEVGIQVIPYSRINRERG